MKNNCEQLNNKIAFTLIELLVAIAVIGVLSGLIVISMNASINSANDAKRKANIDAIRKALVIYSALNGNTYPVETGCNIGAPGGSNPCSTLMSKISDLLPSPPKDPTTGGYYTYVSNGTDYTISALLSNSNFYTYSPSTGFVNSAAQMFTTVGTTSWTAPTGCSSIEILVVGGGGGGGVCYGGGGGGGGIIYYGSQSPRVATSYSVTPGTTYSVIIGAGGTNRVNISGNGGPGGSSSFNNAIIVSGGGYGGGACGGTGGPGGSGGGGSSTGSGNTAGGAGTTGQGSNGSSSAVNEGGGGGGAGGTNVAASRQGSNGISYSISGTSTYYSGGGSGGGATLLNGGLGGGGKGGISLTSGVADATPNTGGGGGGSIISGGGVSGLGGSGIVIIHCK